MLECLFLSVRHFCISSFLLVLLEVPSLALLCGRTCFRLDVIRRGADVGPPIGENILHRQNLRAEVAQLFVDLLDARSGALAGAFVILFEFLIVSAALDFFLRVAGLRTGGLQESGVAVFPFMLESFPRPLSKIFVLQRPEERGHEKDRKSTRLNSSHITISYAVFC